ncbi:MAG: hypothetical protein Q9225_005272 [Loekoesia sp. 1 TL-2023]
MADPLTAMAARNLASNIAQMVDYSLHIVSKSKELRKNLDGATSEHHHTIVVTKSLRDASNALSTYLEKSTGLEKNFDGETTRLQTLSTDCEDIARSLLKELDGLTFHSEGKNLRWNSFRQALKIMWGKEKLDDLAKTLGMYREALKIEITILMLYGTPWRLPPPPSFTGNAGADKLRAGGVKTSYQILCEMRNNQRLSENNFYKLLQSVRSSQSAPTKHQDPPILETAATSTGELQDLLQNDVNVEAIDKEGNTALILASGAGLPANVSSLLEAGANIEARGTRGATSLRAAAKGGHYEVVQLLLARGARLRNPNDLSSTTALDEALENDKWHVANLLLNEGDRALKSVEIVPSKLLRFAEQGNHLAVGALARASANLDIIRGSRRRTPLMIASYSGYPEVAKRLLAAGATTEPRDDHGYTALALAALRGYGNIVRLLLQAGANPNAINKPGWSVLAEASFHGRPEIIDELVTYGAYLETRTDKNYTPLCLAASNSQVGSVERLIHHGANISAQCQDGWTPLAEGCHYGREDIVELLLNAGANTDLSDGPYPDNPGSEDGLTPLMRAARGSHLKIIQMLLEAGADIDAISSEGKTALTISEARSARVYEVLIEARSRRNK